MLTNFLSTLFFSLINIRENRRTFDNGQSRDTRQHWAHRIKNDTNIKK